MGRVAEEPAVQRQRREVPDLASAPRCDLGEQGLHRVAFRCVRPFRRKRRCREDHGDPAFTVLAGHRGEPSGGLRVLLRQRLPTATGRQHHGPPTAGIEVHRRLLAPPQPGSDLFAALHLPAAQRGCKQEQRRQPGQVVREECGPMAHEADFPGGFRQTAFHRARVGRGSDPGRRGIPELRLGQLEHHDPQAGSGKQPFRQGLEGVDAGAGERGVEAAQPGEPGMALLEGP